ncbi:protein regulator of cytokinesis 1-like isoform X2 [Cloeon dipterum]|uniref:protein regulator of cytokinesis 1-like isoform X2 n=1 Tax=Cloeon dipterum TaxID=197152 RepID=UPI00321F8041
MSRRQEYIETSQREISKSVREHLALLASIWEEIGLDEDSYKSRFLACQTHVNALFKEMKEEDTGLKSKLLGKVAALQEQLAVFNLDLDKNESVDVQGLTLIASKSKLDSCLKELKMMHTLRSEERANLEAQEQDLCKQLGRTTEERPAAKCLSDPVMKEFKERVARLRQDKEKLLSGFKETRRDIIELYSDLEEQPRTEFEQRVTDPNVETFPLDPQSLADVATLHERLELQVRQITEETEQYRLKLANLWDRLEVDPMVRTIFLENYPGIRKTTRKELRNEITRCEELKKQNLERFTLRMRDELLGLWEQCHMSEEERAAFEPFRSLDFTEELLELHEAEVKRLEMYFADNREIFDLLSKRAELWDRMCQLEHAATDSNRLNNRGGQLLKEEKERKQIQKELPKVEERVKKLIHAREEANGEPFLLNGHRASLVLSEQWEAKRKQKEAEKQNKKIAQQRQLERDAMMGTTMMSGVNNNLKRKLVPNTPEMGRKLPRVTPAKAPLPTKVSSTAGKVGKFARPVARPTQRKLRMPSPTSSTTQVAFKLEVQNMAEESIASTISYTDFTQALTMGPIDLHSSLDKGSILRQELPAVVQFPLGQSVEVPFTFARQMFLAQSIQPSALLSPVAEMASPLQSPLQQSLLEV